MAGRGRGATLPAWMTSGGLQPLNVSEESTSATSQQALNVSATSAPAAVTSPPTVQEQRPPAASNTAQSYSTITPTTNIQQRTQTSQQFSMAPQPTNPVMFPTPVGYPIGMQMHNFMPPMSMNMSNPNNFAPPFMPPSMGGFAPIGQQYAPMGGMGGMPPAPPMPRIPPTAAPAAFYPSNDITCWTEHKSDAGLKYWYNRVTLVSTYDKPFCLKTPEERSIPPCAWKEYTAADGKNYYSNGKEST